MNRNPTRIAAARRAMTLAAFIALSIAAAGCAGGPSRPADSASPAAAPSAKATSGDAVDLASIAARSVGPRAVASPAETERTRRYLKSYRIFEVSYVTEEGINAVRKVAVGPDDRVLTGQALLDVLAAESIRIPDQKTAREVGALLTDLLQLGNSVIESKVDYQSSLRRYDVEVVALNGGPRYGFTEMVRWTFSLTPEARVLFSYRVVIDRRT